MKRVWHPLAQADREQIFDHVAQENPWAALELDQAFSDTAQTIFSHPSLYRAGRVPGTREAVVNKSFVLVYQVDPGQPMIRILRVLHTAQQWP